MCVCVAYRIGYFQYISKIETQAASPFFYKKRNLAQSRLWILNQSRVLFSIKSVNYAMSPVSPLPKHN